MKRLFLICILLTSRLKWPHSNIGPAILRLSTSDVHFTKYVVGRCCCYRWGSGVSAGGLVKLRILWIRIDHIHWIWFLQRFFSLIWNYRYGNPFYTCTFLCETLWTRSGSTRSEYRGAGFHIIKFKHKMDATPSFGVTLLRRYPKCLLILSWL